MDQGPYCPQRSRARGVVLSWVQRRMISFSELDAGEGLITTATVAECSSGMKLRHVPIQ